jgi:hypothetical protein
LPGWASNCNGAVNGAQSSISDSLPGRLDTLYRAIRSRAAVAKVVVGYPRIFMERGLQRRHLVLPGGGDLAQPDRRPAQQQAVRRRPRTGLLLRQRDQPVPRPRRLRQPRAWIARHT